MYKLTKATEDRVIWQLPPHHHHHHQPTKNISTTMAMALAPTFKPTPLPPAVALPANTIHNAFSSYSPTCSPFSNRNKVSLRKPPAFGTLIKCAAGGVVLEVDETQFSDVVLNSDRPVLVEFVAKWCGPCRLIAPAVQLLAKENEDKLRVVKVDHDANPRLIEEYKVYGLPTLIIFKNGKEVSGSRREGAITKDKLKDYVNKHMESVSIV